MNHKTYTDSKSSTKSEKFFVPTSYAPPPKHKPRPDALIQAFDSLKIYYKNRASGLLSDIKNKSGRVKRIERRSALCVLSQFLTHYCELATLGVGIPNHAALSPFKIADMAKHTGLPRYTLIRALNDLYRAGYLTVERQDAWKRVGCSMELRGRAAIRCLTPKFFQDLGISLTLLNLRRDWKRKKLECELNKGGDNPSPSLPPAPIDAKPAFFARSRAQEMIALLRRSSFIRKKEPPG
jgi:DNA-binding MarR family transcriptional regulator